MLIINNQDFLKSKNRVFVIFTYTKKIVIKEGKKSFVRRSRREKEKKMYRKIKRKEGKILKKMFEFI